MRAGVNIDDDLLRTWPLPDVDGEADKNERGRLLIVAGSPEMPGALLLAAEAALRAGAGKLTVATVASVAQGVALALPEARVIGLPESPGGACHSHGLDALPPLAERFDAILLGPGMQDTRDCADFVRAVLRAAGAVPVLLDALALDVVRSDGDAAAFRFERPVLMTPHGGEFAHLTGIDKKEVVDSAASVCQEWSRRWNAVVALKGASTHIAAPDGRSWVHTARIPGLASSGSGDVLAGVMAGLLCRGVPLEQAAAWGVALHARAGQALERRHGRLGYLARELPAELPSLMQALG